MMGIINAGQYHPSLGGSMPEVVLDADTDDRRFINESVPGNISMIENESISDLSAFSESSDSRQLRYNATGISGRGVAQAVDSYPSAERLVSYNSGGFPPLNFFLQFVYTITAGVGSVSHIMGIYLTFSSSKRYFLTLDSAERITSRGYIFPTGSVGLITSSTRLTTNIPYIIEILYQQSPPLHQMKINGVIEGSTNSVMSGAHTNFDVVYMNAADLASRGPRAKSGRWMFSRTIPDQGAIKHRRRGLAIRYGIDL